MGSFRTPEMEEEYAKHRAAGGLDGECRLCKHPALTRFRHWKITDNNFPYDRVAQIHNMLIPLRHVTEVDLTCEERDELLTIKHGSVIQNTYEFIVEPSRKKRSIPDHFHLHLLVVKSTY